MWGQWIGNAVGAITANVILNVDRRMSDYGLVELQYTAEPADGFRPFSMTLHPLVFNGRDFSGDVVWAVNNLPNHGGASAPAGPPRRNTIRGSLDEHDNINASIDAHNGATELRLIYQETPFQMKCVQLDWHDFKVRIGALPFDAFGRPCWLYRGQDDSKFPLRTSFHRLHRRSLRSFFISDLPRLAYYLEPLLNRRFALNDRDEVISLLHLAQHHGFPTPLLDWTESPFIAAYFAYSTLEKYETYDKDRFVRVYVFNEGSWNKQRTTDDINLNAPPEFSVIRPRITDNARALPQQSVVTFTNVVNIERITNCGARAYISAFDLPAQQRQTAMDDLRKMGITHASLFPGIEGTCRAVREMLR